MPASAKSQAQASIGIIGGSGLYAMPGLKETREVSVKTPFGEPSDSFVLGTLEGRRVAFLARHARGHRFTPTEINYREYLRDEAAWSRARDFRERGRLVAGGFASRRIPGAGPIRGPDEASRVHVLRRRACGARWICAPCLR